MNALIFVDTNVLVYARDATEPARQEIAARYGLDRPLIEQYLIWLGRLAHGDLGNAIVLRQPVAKLIAATDAKMVQESKLPGAKDLAAAFDEVASR